MIKLIPVNNLIPDEDNPRITDNNRLHYIMKSIEYMGFVLPVYRNNSGVILSGHQRTLAAKNLGIDKSPVVEISMDDESSANYNIIFNRTTNDMNIREDGGNTIQLLNDNKQVIDSISSDSAGDMYPCMNNCELILPSELLKNINEVSDASSMSLCSMLFYNNVYMPLVVTESGDIINGRNRLLSYIHSYSNGTLDMNGNKYYKQGYPCTIINDDKKELADLFLNKLSMDFDLGDKYKDKLRHGSFRRRETVVNTLTNSFKFFTNGCKALSPSETFSNPRKFWANWKKLHGRTVVDFGAGQRINQRILEEQGITCYAFEPYPTPMPTDLKYISSSSVRPNIELAKEINMNFIDGIKHCKIDSVFMSAILNSIPFYEDRVKALCVVHSLFNINTVLYGHVIGIQQYNRKMNNTSTGGIIMRNTESGVAAKKVKVQSPIRLDHEAGTVIGDVRKMPKVQKFHTRIEITNLLSIFWCHVKTWEVGQSIYFSASYPKRINTKVLRESIDYEMNVPYPEGLSLGLSDQFKDAISYKHGISLD